MEEYSEVRPWGDLYNPFPKLPKKYPPDRRSGPGDPFLYGGLCQYILKTPVPVWEPDAAGGTFAGKRGTVRRDPYVFVDGAMEMEDVETDGGKDRLYRKRMEKGVPGHGGSVSQAHDPGVVSLRRARKPVKPAELLEAALPVFCRWKEPAHVSATMAWRAREVIYVTSEDGFYRLKGHCVYYERNQMMQGLHDHQKGCPPGRDRLPMRR